MTKSKTNPKNQQRSVIARITATSPEMFEGNPILHQGEEFQGYIDTYGNLKVSGIDLNWVPKWAFEVVRDTEPTVEPMVSKTAHDLRIARKPNVYVDWVDKATYSKKIVDKSMRPKTVAKKLNVSLSTVYYWVKQYNDGGFDVANARSFARKRR